MKRELKERLERLAPIRDISRVSSGSPADLVIRPADGLAKVRTISAIEALARRGMTMLKAKRAVEAMVETGEATVSLPMVESIRALVADLRQAGVKATRLACEPVDVRAIRDKLSLSQEQFALRFNLDLATVQGWEQGRHLPDRPAQAYLRAIAAAPREVAAAQEEEMA